MRGRRIVRKNNLNEENKRENRFSRNNVQCIMVHTHTHTYFSCTLGSYFNIIFFLFSSWVFTNHMVANVERETANIRHLLSNTHTHFTRYKFSRSRFRVQLHKCECKCIVVRFFIQFQFSWRMFVNAGKVLNKYMKNRVKKLPHSVVLLWDWKEFFLHASLTLKLKCLAGYFKWICLLIMRKAFLKIKVLWFEIKKENSIGIWKTSALLKQWPGFS